MLRKSLLDVRRWRLVLALILAGLLAGVLAPAFAQGPSPEPLVPNVEPASLAAASDGGLSEQEAVEAALAAYFANPDAHPSESALLVPPAGAALSNASLDAVHRIYLPLLRRAPQLGQNPPPTPTTPTPVTPTPTTPTPAPSRGADVAVTVWPKPSIIVGRGALLEYEVRLANYGSGDAAEVKLVFPYNRQQLTLEATSLNSKAGDWVSAIEAQSFTVTFGKLRAGEKRSGKLMLRVNNGLVNQTLLDVRASYRWSDGDNGGEARANWTPVLVGSGASDAPYVWLQATPDRGPAGIRHSFLTNRMLPNEEVTTWLNTPQGVRPLATRGTADGEGTLRLSLVSNGLAKGSYQIVFYGTRSGLTGVAGFVVQ